MLANGPCRRGSRHSRLHESIRGQAQRCVVPEPTLEQDADLSM